MRDAPMLLLIVGLLLVVLTYGTAYKIGVACLLIWLVWLLLVWFPAWRARNPNNNA